MLSCSVAYVSTLLETEYNSKMKYNEMKIDEITRNSDVSKLMMQSSIIQFVRELAILKTSSFYGKKN